ncbi:MAG: hypothetical protein CM15mV17_1630 [Caudoviricetes sp.]|nr:MAG: hypothetical protein CM15mV17_1630 [Caudoviricetes sp.]
MSKHHKDYPLTDYLNSINHTKEDLRERGDDWMKKYPPFIVNKCFSGFKETVLYANALNEFHQLDNDLQYSFYLNSLRKKRRFSPWQRKDKIENLDLIKNTSSIQMKKHGCT